MFMLNEGTTISNRWGFVWVCYWMITFTLHFTLRKEKLDGVGVKVKELHRRWEEWSDEERFHTILDILKVLILFKAWILIFMELISRMASLSTDCGIHLTSFLIHLLPFSSLPLPFLFSQLLGVRGVLDLLGLRCTVGSTNLLPPPRSVLLASFNKQHHPAAKLSEGGRALAKHCHRDDTLKWWGTCTGSELVLHVMHVVLFT